MRARLLVMSLTLFLVIGVGTASAFVWHMRYGQAKSASKEFSKRYCSEDPECTGWGVGQCYRKSESSFACEIGSFYADSPNPGEETECNVTLHWGACRSGYVVLKNHGRPHCFQI